ncbi:MAG TPA: hypothetical protein DCX07_01410 [Phycisphaerales bacterium]|nr:hypothetical protein [Phycisphaerales bacterium]
MTSANAGSSGGIGLQPGSRIGKYEVRERLGVGGQAIVYKCYDALLDRHVAIKQISNALAADPRFLERFRREAQILAKLGAEIITIHELIEEERGLFIVMEFVEGHTLETTLNDTKGPVETKAALQVLFRLAATLHEVHRAGIIHRDLKPTNIIITPGLRPRITDFGVAASLSGQTSMVLGTTKYMAPELFEGPDVDARADMYSLGFIAYEMLVGRPKFNEIFADIIRDRHSEALRWMKWHGNRSVQAPPVCEVNPSVPKNLSELVMKMIAKDPAERYANMEELGRAIKATFSPRARAGAGGVEKALATKGRLVARAAVKSGALAAEGPIGAGDEADELELAGPPATAPLPKRSLSLRTKLILAGVAVVSLAVIGIILGVQASQSEQRRAQAAQTAYDDAMSEYLAARSSYETVRFQTAAKGFQDAVTKYAGTAWGARAGVMTQFAKGYLAAVDSDWAQAAAQEEAIQTAINGVEVAAAVEPAWIDRQRQELESFKTYWRHTRIFVEEMGKAREAFTGGRLDEAMRTLQERLRDLKFTDAQYRQYQQFRKEIAEAQFLGEFQAELDRGDGLAGKGEFAQATVAYQRAETLLNSPAAEALDKPRRDALRQGLADRMKKVGVSSEYRDAMDRREAARQAGNLSEELNWLIKADEIMPSPGNKKAIAELKSNIALAKGLAALDAKNYTEAKARLLEALEHNAASTAARDALNRLESEQKWETLVKAGDAALGAGQHQAALEKYQAAAAIRADAHVTQNIAECKYQLTFAQAQQEQAAGKFAEAKASYEACLQLKPASRAQIDAILAKMDQDQRYSAFLAEGDALRKKKDFAGALKAYREAGKIYDNQEIKDRKDLSRYEEYLTLGKQEMEQGDFRTALGHLKVAQGYRDTDEIKQLIREAEQKARD